MGPGKPGKSWNFILTSLGLEKDWVLESPENLLNSRDTVFRILHVQNVF